MVKLLTGSLHHNLNVNNNNKKILVCLCLRVFMLAVKDVCRNVSCGHGSCVLTSAAPFHECKCRPPYRPPNCKKGPCFYTKNLLRCYPKVFRLNFINISLSPPPISCRLQTQPVSERRLVQEGPQTLLPPVFLPCWLHWKVLRSW